MFKRKEVKCEIIYEHLTSGGCSFWIKDNITQLGLDLIFSLVLPSRKPFLARVCRMYLCHIWGPNVLPDYVYSCRYRYTCPKL